MAGAIGSPWWILEELKRRGVDVRPGAGGKLKLTPAPPPDLLEMVKKEKPALLQLVAGESCPYCHQPIEGRKCWKCFLAVCACGTPTGSAFISVCRRCEVEECRRLGLPY